MQGSIDNIASGSTKFLGHLLGESLQASHQAASERKELSVRSPESIDQRPVRCKYDLQEL